MRYVSLLLLSSLFLTLQSTKLQSFSFRDSQDVPIIKSAAKDQMEAGTVENRVIVPLNQQYHPSSAKAWVIFQGTATVTINASYNVSSITDSGVGNYVVNFVTPFSSTNYCVTTSAYDDSGNYTSITLISDSAALATGSVSILTARINTLALVDTEKVFLAAFGDQ